LGGIICGCLPFALIITLLWRRLRLQPTAFPPALLAALPFFGSFLFVYSGSFHGHLLAALFMLVAWQYRGKGSAFAAGFFAGAAVLSEYTLFVFPLAWLIQDLARRERKNIRNLVLGGLPGLLLLLAMDRSVTGHA